MSLYPCDLVPENIVTGSRAADRRQILGRIINDDEHEIAREWLDDTLADGTPVKCLHVTRSVGDRIFHHYQFVYSDSDVIVFSPVSRISPFDKSSRSAKVKLLERLRQYQSGCC